MGGSEKTVSAEIPNATQEEKDLWKLIENYDKIASSQASSLAEKGYSDLMAISGKAPDFSALSNENQSRLDDIYRKYAELYEGKLNDNYQKNMEASLQRGYENTLGSSINNLSNRGVLNSKVTNTAINSQQKNLASAMANAFQSNINTEASLLKGQSDLASQKISDAGTALNGQLVLPTTYYTIGSALQDKVDKDWQTMYNGRYSVATPAQTITTGSVLGGILGGFAQGAGLAACFVGDTLVTMANGTKKCIKDIVVGDIVMNYDIDSDCSSLGKVIKVCEPVLSADQYINIVGDYFNITTTSTQGFYTEGGEFLSSDLVVGDKLIGVIPYRTTKIKDIIFVDDKELVYDFVVEGFNNYFVDDVLVNGGVL